MKTENTEDLLLQAALKLISEKGYLGSTTKDIAREAGVTELTLFRHFGTKEQLFGEVLNKYSFLPKLRELLPELAGLARDEAFVLIATRFLQFLKERQALIRIFYQEITNYPDIVKEVYNNFIDEIRATLAGYIRTLQMRGEIRKDLPPETTARAFLAMFFGYFRQEEIMRPGGMKQQAMEKYVRDVVDIFILGASTISRQARRPAADVPDAA